MANRQQRRASKSTSAKVPETPNTSGTDERCGNCKFMPKALREDGNKSGLCVRYPASVNPMTGHSQFPAMMFHGWCGEWKAQ